MQSDLTGHSGVRERGRLYVVGSAHAALTIAGFALLAILTIAYARDGLRLVRQVTERAEQAGQAVVQPIGDIALRDVPKANAILQGRWFDDPHYPGEVHWYPFATPLAAALYANLLHAPLQPAYLIVAVLFGAAALAAAGALMYIYFGLPGLAFFPIAVLLGLFWPDNATYPISTSHAALFLLLGVAGMITAMARPEPGASAASGWLFALLGALTGLLGLWHGASLVTAGVISLCLLVWVTAARRRARAGPRAALAPALLYGLAFAACISPLLAPQIIRYGTLRQSDAARLFLIEDYQGGNLPEALFSLRLFPRGADAVWLAIFALSLFVGGDRAARMKRVPLAIGYLFCILLGHLGFVLHSSQYPRLAKLSSTLLIAPAHTFYWLSLTLLTLIKMVVVGAALGLTLDLAKSRLLARSPRRSAAGRIATVGGGAALAVTYGLLLVRPPAQQAPPSRTVKQAEYDFAAQVSAIAGPNDAVYVEYEWGHWELMQVYPFKLVYFLSPFHRNPYVDQPRARADERLGLVGNDAQQLAQLLRDNHVRYVATMPGQPSLIAALCSGPPILESPAGHRLYRLADRCALPDLAQQAALAPNDRLGLLVDAESPVIVSGIKPGAKDNFLSFPKLAPAKGAITELRVQGQVLGGAADSCVKLRVGFLKGKKVFVTREQIAHVSGSFDIRSWFISYDAATEIAPQVSFVPECIAAGQKILIRDVTISTGQRLAAQQTQ